MGADRGRRRDRKGWERQLRREGREGKKGSEMRKLEQGREGGGKPKKGGEGLRMES